MLNKTDLWKAMHEPIIHTCPSCKYEWTKDRSTEPKECTECEDLWVDRWEDDWFGSNWVYNGK